MEGCEGVFQRKRTLTQLRAVTILVIMAVAGVGAYSVGLIPGASFPHVPGDVPVAYASSGATFTATELLGRPTDTSITVNVVPSSNGLVYFEYGTATGVYTGQTSEATLTSGTPTDIVMQGLTPNTRYYYRMVSSLDGVNWTEGDEHTFQTQRATGSTFTFTITSDSHVNIVLGSATTWKQTMTNVANDHPDFEIDCGDTFAMDGVTTASGADQAYLYQRQFFDIVGNSAAIFLAIGNHEQQEAWHLKDTATPATSPPVLGVNAEKKYYLNPVPDSFYSGNTDPYSYLSGDHLREDYYAWTWGDALFVVIDPYWYTTTKPYFGGGTGETYAGSGNRWDWTLGLQQFTWLKQTLQNSDAKYKFVFAHHMTGGSSDYGGRGGAVPANLVEWGGYNVDGTTWGWDTNRPVAQWGSEPVEQIMVDNHVSAFFHGHDHEYAYEKRDGIVYQSLPAAGFSGYGFNSYSLGTYTLKVLPSPGHLSVTVTPMQVTVDYIATTGGTVNYSYTINANSGNNPPTAAYTWTANGLGVSLDGSTSSDSDGTIASYAWTFGDSQTGSGVNPSHTYASAGTYTVGLTVTDNDGATGYIQHDVTVSPANVPPTAAFTFSPSNPVAGATVAFIDKSWDSDGSIASWLWSFGDGGTSTGQNPTHQYMTAGTYTVTLTVTNNSGSKSSSSQTVTVTPSPTYVVTISVNPTGAGTTNPSAGTYAYAAGSQVTITATAASGYAFVNWSGDASGTSLTATVTMNSNKNIIANFKASTNLALKKTATADSSQWGCGPAYGDDGNPSTRWCAANGYLNHWWKVDLGATHSLTGTEVMWQFARNYKYKVEVSTDNISWTLVADKTKNTGSAQTQKDSFTATARYVRITVTGLPSYTWASFYEFRVFGN